MAYFSNRHFDAPALAVPSAFTRAHGALSQAGRGTSNAVIQKIGDLPVSALTTSSQAAVDEVQALLNVHAECDAIAVLDADGVAVGIADRALIEHRLAHPYGRPLFSHKPISRLMKRHFAVLDFDDSIETAAERFVESFGDFDYEYFLITKDGAFWGVASVSALMIQIAFLSLKVRRLNSELSGARQRAEKARVLETEKARLFSIIDHDVQTPLHAIAGYIEILRFELGESANKNIDYYLYQIEKSSAEMSSRLSDIVDIAGLSADAKPVRDQFSISELVKDVHLKFEDKISAQAQKFEYKESCGLSYVECDAAAMRKILEHIFENFVENAGVDAALTVHVACDHAGFALHCFDDGPGFPNAVLADLASPYGSAGDDGGGSRVGPGLAIMRALVALQDGRFEASNRTPHGASIRISLGDTPTRAGGCA